jgi:hypothetical protein
MTAEAWIRSFAEAAGSTPPSETEIGKLLKLAAVAAHSSERIAAPMACWVAGREGLDLDEAIAMAERIGAEGG